MVRGGKTYVPADLDDHGMEKVHRRNYHWSWPPWPRFQHARFNHGRLLACRSWLVQRGLALPVLTPNAVPGPSRSEVLVVQEGPPHGGDEAAVGQGTALDASGGCRV